MLSPENTAQRVAFFEKLLGPTDKDLVFHSPDNRIPHVDVYVVPPSDKTPLWTYFTDGVSEREMAVPSDLRGVVIPRIELVAHSRELNPRVPSVLKQMIDTVFSRQTFLAPFQTYRFVHGVTGLPFRHLLLHGMLYKVDSPEAVADFRPPECIIEGNFVAPLLVLPLTPRDFRFVVSRAREEVIDAFIEHPEVVRCLDYEREAII